MNRCFLRFIVIGSLLMLMSSVGYAAHDKEDRPAQRRSTVHKKEPRQEVGPVTPPQQLPEPAPAEPATGEQINWLVIGKGGSFGTSANYQLGVTIGQVVAGYGTSANYGLNLGFWQDFGGCCVNRGNVDGVIGPYSPVDVADATYLVAFLFKGGAPPVCEEEGNVDGVMGPYGPTDVADLTYLVSFLWKGGPEPPPCD